MKIKRIIQRKKDNPSVNTEVKNRNVLLIDLINNYLRTNICVLTIETIYARIVKIPIKENKDSKD